MSFLTVYDPDPEWYRIVQYILSTMSVISYTTGMLCLYRVKLPGMSEMYRRIMAYNLTFGVMSAVYFTYGNGLVFDFPLSGVHGTGFLAALGIPIKYLAAIQLSIIVNVGYGTFLLFRYRHEAIISIPSIPTSVKISIFVFATVSSLILPHPVNMLIFSLQNATAIKIAACETQKWACDRVPNFWTDSVLIFSLDTSILQKVFFLYYLFMIITLVGYVGLLTYRLTFVLGKMVASRATLSMHRALVRSLLMQTAVHYGLFVIPVIGMLMFCLFNVDLPGASHIFTGLLLFSHFAGDFTMIVTHASYVHAVLRCLSCGKYSLGNRMSSAAISAIASSSTSGGASMANRVVEVNRPANRVVAVSR